VLNHYVPGGNVFWRHFGGQWTDAGTIESLLQASRLASEAATGDVSFVTPTP